MLPMRKLPLVIPLAMLGLAALAPPTAKDQPKRRSPTIEDVFKSTEVAPDKKVTFRIYAPKADDVSVGGDFMVAPKADDPFAPGVFGQRGKMSKDDQGIWSITLGPLTPDFYSYTFTVDGVRTVDPKNPTIKQGVSSPESIFPVPGPEADFEAANDVPHGEVRAAWYRSTTLDQPRRMHIYTPPGYEKGDAKYPVLYLLHGGGDDDSGWTTIGRAGFILDNLIAARKALPMIVVMPDSNLPPPKHMPARPVAGEAPSPEFSAAIQKMLNGFNDELLNDVVPAVEKTYRVKAGRDNRALAGPPVDDGQVLRVLVAYPEDFAYVGIWGAGIFNAANRWAKLNEDFLAAKDRPNRAIKRLEIVVGDEDFALTASKALSQTLKKRGIEHDLRLTAGEHTWISWRRNLNDLAPRLFR